MPYRPKVHTLMTNLSLSLEVMSTLLTVHGAAPLYISGTDFISTGAPGTPPAAAEVSLDPTGTNLLTRIAPDSITSPTYTTIIEIIYILCSC